MNRSRSVLVAFAAFVVAAGAAALAQESDGTDVQLSEPGDYGMVLVDDEGMSLYLYTEDGDTIACVDACTTNWRPLTVEDGESVSVARELDPELVDTVERPDGTLQVTYGGNPLYTYARDAEPGSTNGQSLGGSFFLVSVVGEAVRERVPQERVDMEPDLFDALFEEGRSLYSNQCAVCHGGDGQGQVGPSLETNRLLGNNEFLIARILNGFPEHGMPAFRGQLDDREIAAVSTFIRDSWGNEFGGIYEEEVIDLR